MHGRAFSGFLTVAAAAALGLAATQAPAGERSFWSHGRSSSGEFALAEPPGGYHEMPGEFLPAPAPANYPHFERPSRYYGLWYRPRDFGLNTPERCTYDTFRPRGLGNIFAEPRTCERMDYVPYTPRTPFSQYGPAYYRRLPSPYCGDYHCFYPETYSPDGNCNCRDCDLCEGDEAPRHH